MDTNITSNFKQTDRQHHIDFAKGILICLMVMFHIHYTGAYPNLMANVYTAVFAFHMSAFLIFNGMLVKFDRPLGQQFKNLLRSLVIPYILFEFIYITLLFLADKMGLKFANAITDYNPIQVLRYVFLIPIGAYWYLHTLIIGLAISYLVNKLFKNKTSAILASAILYWAAGHVITGFAFSYSVFIILGLILNYYQIQIKASWVSFVAMAVIIFVSLPYLPGFSLAGIALSFLVISALYQLYIWLPGNNAGNAIKRYFNYIGCNTLIIVLIHPIFLNILKPLSKFIIGIDHSGISYLIIATVITVAFCCLCGKLVDAIGLSKLLFGKKIYVDMHRPVSPAL